MLLINKKIKNKKFDNTAKGFHDLSQWLKNKEVDTAHACIEATGD